MTTWSILALLPLVAVAMSVFGLVWLTLGVRGKPIFSSPRCAKCGYDLRNMQFMPPETVGNCPECGNDLAAAGGVTFGRWKAQPSRIVVGVAMMILPWVLTFVLVFAMRSRAIVTA